MGAKQRRGAPEPGSGVVRRDKKGDIDPDADKKREEQEVS